MPGIRHRFRTLVSHLTISFVLPPYIVPIYFAYASERRYASVVGIPIISPYNIAKGHMKRTATPGDLAAINYSKGEAQHLLAALNGSDAYATRMRAYWVEWQRGDDAKVE